METRMRKKLLIILGILVFVGLTIQMAIAAPHGARKAGRVSPNVTRQLRDTFGSASKADESKSCDRFWCYEN